MQGGGSVGVGAADVGAVFDQEADGIGLVGDGGPFDGGDAHGITFIGVGAGLEELLEGAEVSGSGGVPDMVGGGGAFVFFDTAPVADAVDERGERESAEGEGEEDSFGAVGEEAFGTALLPHHGGEEAADDEEGWHTKAVDGVLQEAVGLVILVDILCGPDGEVGIGEGAVQDDSEQHGEAAEGIEFVVALGAAVHS